MKTARVFTGNACFSRAPIPCGKTALLVNGFLLRKEWMDPIKDKLLDAGVNTVQYDFPLTTITTEQEEQKTVMGSLCLIPEMFPETRTIHGIGFSRGAKIVACLAGSSCFTHVVLLDPYDTKIPRPGALDMPTDILADALIIDAGKKSIVDMMPCTLDPLAFKKLVRGTCEYEQVPHITHMDFVYHCVFGSSQNVDAISDRVSKSVTSVV